MDLTRAFVIRSLQPPPFKPPRGLNFPTYKKTRWRDFSPWRVALPHAVGGLKRTFLASVLLLTRRIARS